MKASGPRILNDIICYLNVIMKTWKRILSGCLNLKKNQRDMLQYINHIQKMKLQGVKKTWL